LEYKLLAVGIQSRYSEYLLMKSIRQKRVGKNNGIGIETIGIEKC